MDRSEPDDRTAVTGAEAAPDTEQTVVASGAQPAEETQRTDELEDRLAIPLSELLKSRLRKTGEGGRLGRYLILRLLGEGGMGSVFSAYDEELDRKVAIKLLRADGPAGRLDRDWLLSEAKAMARLSHPNVVQVYDVGEFDEVNGDGQIFIAMELVTGTTLGRWLRESKRERAAILDILIQAGEGLAAVHAAGLIHRDFKPANVLLGDDGRARVLDFGLAYRPAILGADQAEARPGESLVSQTHAGTPAYMAPEQHLDQEVDARADQFAFGVTLHEALYGKRPFVGRSVREISAAVIANDRQSSTDTKLPARLRRIIDRALQPLPGERYPSMSALLDQLKSDPWRARKLALVIGGLSLALVATLALLAKQRNDDAAREAAACAGSEARIAAVWSDERRAAVERSFVATSLPYAEDTWSKIQRRLDAYAEEWIVADRASCEERRGGVLTDSLYERAAACLDGSRRELGALVTVYADADAKVVESALKASEALPRIDRCRDRQGLVTGLMPVTDPKKAAGVAEIRDTIAAVNARANTSHTDQCPRLDRAVATAKALAYRPLIAELAMSRGRCAELGGDYQSAQERFQEALTEAIACAHDRLAVNAGSRLAYVLAMRLGEGPKAEPWLRIAESIVDRVDADAGLRGALLMTKGSITLARGQPEEARPLLESALDLLRDFHGERHSSVGIVLNNLAVLHAHRGQTAELCELFAEAYELSSEYLGPDHPNTLMVGGNLSNAYLQIEDFAKAEALMLELIERTATLLGPDHPDIAPLELNLGALEQRRALTESTPETKRRREGLVRARGHLQRAVALREAALGRESPRTAFTKVGLAEIHNDLGEPEIAKSLLEQAIAVLKANDPQAPDHAYALSRLGRSLSELGQHKEALATLYEAKLIHDLGNSKPAEVAYTKLQRAKAITRASRKPGDRAHARALAEEALATLRDLVGFDYERREVETWLADHPAPR